MHNMHYPCIIGETEKSAFGGLLNSDIGCIMVMICRRGAAEIIKTGDRQI